MQFWATLAFQSVTDGPPEQFWDTAGLKNQRFVQFVPHLGAFRVHFWSIFCRQRPLKPKFLLPQNVNFQKIVIFSVWGRFDNIFGHSGVAWPAALFGAFRALLGHCRSSPGGHSDTPRTLFNSIWVLWHAQKVAGSTQKAILA